MSEIERVLLRHGTPLLQLPFVNPRTGDRDWVYASDQVFIEGGDPATRTSLVEDFLVEAVGRGYRVVLGLVKGSDIHLRSFASPNVEVMGNVRGLRLTPREFDQLALRQGVPVLRAGYDQIDRALVAATERHPADLTIVHGMPQLDDNPVGRRTYPLWVCERLADNIRGALVITASRPASEWPDSTYAAYRYGTLIILPRRLRGPHRAIRELSVERKGSDPICSPYVPRSERSGDPPWMQRLSELQARGLTSPMR